MYVYQCPECNLRFQYATELEHHLRVDHPDFEVTPKSIEDALMSASHRPRHARRFHVDDQK
jgi:hypothetical protein